MASTPGLLEFSQKLSPAQRQVFRKSSRLLWTLDNVRYIDNNEFNVADTPYLADIFEDEAADIAAMKSAQTRISMTILARYFQTISALAFTGIYYFPTDTAMQSFVQGRVDPLLRRNKELQDLVKETDRVSIKSIGFAFAYFLGLASKTAKESIAADHIVYDEYDLMAPDDVETSLERIAASSYKRVTRLGNPTIPDAGIDYQFKQTDQKFWACRCSSGHWNTYLDDYAREGETAFNPAWIEQGFLACKKCRKPVDPRIGAWVAKKPQVKRSGYQISRLFAKNADFAKMLENFKVARNRANFFNRGLGIPWSDKASKLTAEQVLALCGPSPMLSRCNDTTAGIDVNPVAGHHVVISRPGLAKLREIIFLGVLSEFDEIAQVLKRFGVRKFVIDGMPDQEHARKLCKSFDFDGWMCYYSDTQTNSAKWDADEKKVNVNRTESLDASQGLLRDGHVELPHRGPVVETFAQHAANLAKTYETNEKGITVARYVQLGAGDKPDHFRHAWNYDCLAWFDGQVERVTGTTGIIKQPQEMEDAPEIFTGTGKKQWL